MHDTLSQTFAALADPTRRAMLARLSKGEANVSELARPFLKDMSLPAVTKHSRCWKRPASSPRPGKPSGAPASSTATASKTWPTGWSSTACSGKKVSTDWMPI